MKAWIYILMIIIYQAGNQWIKSSRTPHATPPLSSRGPQMQLHCSAINSVADSYTLWIICSINPLSVSQSVLKILEHTELSRKDWTSFCTETENKQDLREWKAANTY